jgi:hypothetical protein
LTKKKKEKNISKIGKLIVAWKKDESTSELSSQLLNACLKFFAKQRKIVKVLECHALSVASLIAILLTTQKICCLLHPKELGSMKMTYYNLQRLAGYMFTHKLINRRVS